MMDFDLILAKAEEVRAARAVVMPTTDDAMLVLRQAYQRLKELGWREAMYCPKDGSYFEAIDVGGGGIMEHCHYMGEWPGGHYFADEAGDMWPARPILWRPKRREPTRGPSD